MQLADDQRLGVLEGANGSFIAAGAGIAAAISPFSLMFSVTASLGITFFSFSPDPYLLPMAISLLALFAGSVWIIVSAFRIGKVNWGAFLLAGGITFFWPGYLRAQVNGSLKVDSQTVQLIDYL